MIGNVLMQILGGGEVGDLPLGKGVGKGEAQGPGEFMGLLQGLLGNLSPEISPQEGLVLTGQAVDLEGRPANEDFEEGAIEAGSFSAVILDLLLLLREMLPRMERDDGFSDGQRNFDPRRDIALLSRSVGLRPGELLQALEDVVRGYGGEGERELLQGLVSAGLSKEGAEGVVKVLSEKARGGRIRLEEVDGAKVDGRPEGGKGLLDISGDTKGGRDWHAFPISMRSQSGEKGMGYLSDDRGGETFHKAFGALAREEISSKKISDLSEVGGQILDSPRAEKGIPIRDLEETEIVKAPALEKGKVRFSRDFYLLIKEEPSGGMGEGVRIDTQSVLGLGESARKVAGERVRLAVITAVNQLISMRRIPGGVRLRLFPPELGSLRIDLQMKGGDLLVRILPEEVSAHHILKEHVEGIHQHLSQHLSFGEVKVELLPAMEGSQDAQEGLWQGGGNHQHREDFSGQGRGTNGDDSEDASSFKGIFQEVIDVIV